MWKDWPSPLFGLGFQRPGHRAGRNECPSSVAWALNFGIFSFQFSSPGVELGESIGHLRFLILEFSNLGVELGRMAVQIRRLFIEPSGTSVQFRGLGPDFGIFSFQFGVLCVELGRIDRPSPFPDLGAERPGRRVGRNECPVPRPGLGFRHF